MNFFAFTQEEARVYAQAFDLEQTASKLLKNECICDEPLEARRQFKCPVHQPESQPEEAIHGQETSTTTR